MTIQEVLDAGGFGYREANVTAHRGSSLTGYIDVKWYLESGTLKVADIMATDWVAKERAIFITRSEFFKVTADSLKESYSSTGASPYYLDDRVFTIMANKLFGEVK